MALISCQAMLGLGAFFIVLGLIFILWGRRERKAYYNSTLGQRDLKEFIAHEPERLWMNAWQIGGRISLIVGVILATAGGVLWLVLY